MYDTSDVNRADAAIKEAKILKKIECDLINQLVAFYEDPQVNKSYLVLEFSGQSSLTKFMRERKQEQAQAQENNNKTVAPLLSEELVRTVMRQLFQAVEYMHRKGICHRDLKPDNIMISSYTPPSHSQQNANDSHSQGSSSSHVDAIKIKVIDLNVAFEVTPENPRIAFATGLKEWSAPETRT